MVKTFGLLLAQIAIGVWTFPYATALTVARDMLSEPLGALSALPVVVLIGIGVVRTLRVVARHRADLARLTAVPVGLVLLLAGFGAVTTLITPDTIAGVF